MSHLILVVVIIAQSLPVLVQLAHEHLPRAEIKGAEVHLVTKVTGQLRLAPKLLPRWTNGEAETRETVISISSLTEKQEKHKNIRHQHRQLNTDEGSGTKLTGHSSKKNTYSTD